MSVIVLDYCNGSSGGFDWVPDTDKGTIWIENEQNEMSKLGFEVRVRTIEIPEDVSHDDVTEWLKENVEMM